MEQTTVINHKIRIELNLSCNEYCIADFLYPEKAMTLHEIGVDFGMSKQTVTAILKRLQSTGIVEKRDKRLITTAKWNQFFEQKSKNILPENFIFNHWAPKAPLKKTHFHLKKSLDHVDTS